MLFKIYSVVDEDCYPYEAARGSCRIHPKKNEKTNLNHEGCRPVLEPRTRFYTMGPAYPLANDEKDIMIEILQSGPVQATFRVYRDFFSYKGGIYKRSAADRDFNDFKYHAVKIVGWGEEYKGYSTEKYWVSLFFNYILKKLLTNFVVHRLLPIHGELGGARMVTSGFYVDQMNVKLKAMSSELGLTFCTNKLITTLLTYIKNKCNLSLFRQKVS